MSLKVLPLNDIQIKNIKPKEKDFKMFDGGGLFLLVKTDGSKLWRCKFRFGGMEKLASFGKYPQVSLFQVRQKLIELKAKVADGINPIEEKMEAKKNQKQQQKQDDNTLTKVFNDWYEVTKPKRAQSTNEHTFRAFEKNLKPWLGNKPIAEITKSEIIDCLKRLDNRTGGESGRRLKILCGQVWRYALTYEYVPKNIIAEIDGSIILKQSVKKEMAHLTDEKEFAGLLRDIDNYKGHFITISALKLASLLFVRPLNIRHMEWVEIDFNKKTWTIPAQKTDDDKEQRQGNRMKMNRAHIVPLADRVIDILNDLKPLTGVSKYVFPSTIGFSNPLSENTLSGALSNMGYKNKQTAHGFRHTASTILNENKTKYGIALSESDLGGIIEVALAHADRNSIRQIYNKAQYVNERFIIMNWWADYLNDLKTKKF
jgi:integrase